MSTDVAEDWEHQSLTPRREAERAAERLSEDHAGDMRAVLGHRARTRLVVYQRVDTPQPGTTEAGMVQIDRAVDDRDAYVRIHRYLVSKHPQVTEDGFRLGRLRQPERRLPFERRLWWRRLSHEVKAARISHCKAIPRPIDFWRCTAWGIPRPNWVRALSQMVYTCVNEWTIYAAQA
jgi:hypothetical protein